MAAGAGPDALRLGARHRDRLVLGGKRGIFPDGQPGGKKQSSEEATLGPRTIEVRK